MKRMITLSLILVLLLCMLPTTAFAGGGGAALVWSEDFQTDLSDGWTVVDANHDGYSFGWNSDGYVQSGAIVGMGLLPEKPQTGVDYLVSPLITLREGEAVLTYDARTLSGAPDVLFDVFVLPDPGFAIEENMLNALDAPIYHDALYSWGGNGTQWTSRTLDLTAYAGQTVALVFRQRAEYQGCCMMLDNISIYWNEPDDILDKVTALSAPVPKVGGKVSDCLESDVVFPDFANYELVPGSLTYYHTVDEQSKVYNGAFEAGEEYSMTFQVKVKAGSTVSETGLASVNGRHAFFLRESDQVVRVSVCFDRLRKPLKSVALTVTPPLAGRIPNPADARSDDPAKCVLVAHDFFTEAGYPVEGAAFALGENYRIQVLLGAAEGWEMTDQTKVTINGKPTTFSGWNLWYRGYYVDVTVDRVLFRDVKPAMWYTDAVVDCFNRGLMAGTGDGYSFSPNVEFTRAMFVTVLSKIAGVDTSNYTGSHFTDVKPGKWYSGAVEWAYQNGYAGGTGNGKFSPNAAVTRESLALFLYNYTVKNYGSQDTSADLSAYPDAKDVSSWAKDAMQWAVDAGLIGGKTVNGQVCLCPQNTATRAEVAVIVAKYVQYLDSMLPV